MLTKRESKQLDKAIEAAFYSCCRGVQIPIMEIGGLFKHGREFMLSDQPKPHGIGQELRAYCEARGWTP